MHTVKRLNISSDSVDRLKGIVNEFGHPPSIGIHAHFWHSLGEAAYNALNDGPFACDLRCMLDEEDEKCPGYVVLDGFEASEAASNVLLGVIALIGTPLALIPHLGYWQVLGVDPQRPPHKFGGVGYNHLHTDVANSTRPPRFVCLFCIRADPRGGGETIVSNIRTLLPQIVPADLSELCRPQWMEGQFFGMQGAGSELCPFPMLSFDTGARLLPRFTAKLLATLPDNDQRRVLER